MDASGQAVLVEPEPDEIPNAVRLVVVRIHKKTWHTRARKCCVVLGESEESTEWANELKCGVCLDNELSKSHLLAELADTYTDFNQDV